MGSNAALPTDTYDLDGDSNTAETIPYDYEDEARVHGGTVDMGIYESLVNQVPVVSDIPDQTIEAGSTFATFDLDTYGSDPGDTLTWSFTGNTDLTVSIDADNVTTITVPANWTGAETITFTATDGDNTTDADSATFTVNAIQNLILNGGFETAGESDKVPADWTLSKTLGSDRRVCNTADKTVTPYGECAFRYKAKTVQPSRKLKQNIAIEGMLTGDTLSLSYNARGKKLTGKIQVIVQVYYSATDSVKLKSKLSQGTFDWQTVTVPDTIVLAEIPVKVQILIKASGSTGLAYLDEVVLSKGTAGVGASLSVIPSGIPLPTFNNRKSS
jgi:hypothetical protein